jgi:hypothetical protein
MKKKQKNPFPKIFLRWKIKYLPCPQKNVWGVKYLKKVFKKKWDAPQNPLLAKRASL